MSASAAWPVAHLMQLPRGAYMLARAADRLPSTLCSLGSPRRRAHGRRHVAAASSDVAPRRRQRASDIALRRRACASTRLCALPARTPCTQAAPKPVLRAGGQVATTAPAPSSAGRSSAIVAADPHQRGRPGGTVHRVQDVSVCSTDRRGYRSCPKQGEFPKGSTWRTDAAALRNQSNSLIF